LKDLEFRLVSQYAAYLLGVIYLINKRTISLNSRITVLIRTNNDNGCRKYNKN